MKEILDAYRQLLEALTNQERLAALDAMRTACDRLLAEIGR